MERLVSHEKAQHKTKMTRKTVVLITLLLCVVTAFAKDDFKPKTVFLIRHAEREVEPQRDPPLTQKGVARSQELARLLGGAGIKAIYTSQFERTKQTAGPLATKLGLTITTISLKTNPLNPRQIAEDSTKEVVNKILEGDGENVLVVGHSNSIPDVIKMLGSDVVPTIDDRKSDDLFIVTVYAKGKAKLTQLKYGAE